MNEIDKYKVLAVMVRGFFEAFASGVIDCKEDDPQEKRRPQAVMRAMLEHFESIAPEFHNLMFPLIATMNHDYATLVSRLTAASGNGQLTAERMLAMACADEAMHKAVVEEYKRNFMWLLEGRYETARDHLDNYTRNAGKPDTIAVDKAISATVKTVVKAYARGRHCGGGQTDAHVTTPLVLVIETLPLLLNDEPTAVCDGDTDSLDEVLLKACGSEENLNVTAAAMQEAQMELMQAEQGKSV